MESALPFWEGILGLERGAGADEGEGRRRILATPGEGPGRLLELVVDEGRKGRWGVGSVHHLALGVDDLGALLKWKRRLADHDVPSSGPIDRGYFHSLYFSDPHGQVVELATAGPGYALDEAPDALGREEVIPDPERLPGTAEREALEAGMHPEPVPHILPEMELRGIHHVSGITHDLEQSHAFLVQALGLRLVKRTVNQDDNRTRHWFWARYDGRTVAPRSAYTLFGWPGSDYRGRAGWGQTRTVAFQAGHQPLEGWERHLRSLGVQTGAIVEEGPWRRMGFTAPDGQEFAIVDPVPTDPRTHQDPMHQETP
jgi:glyoxalase family protein